MLCTPIPLPQPPRQLRMNEFTVYLSHLHHCCLSGHCIACMLVKHLESVNRCTLQPLVPQVPFVASSFSAATGAARCHVGSFVYLFPCRKFGQRFGQNSGMWKVFRRRRHRALPQWLRRQTALHVIASCLASWLLIRIQCLLLCTVFSMKMIFLVFHGSVRISFAVETWTCPCSLLCWFGKTNIGHLLGVLLTALSCRLIQLSPIGHPHQMMSGDDFCSETQTILHNKRTVAWLWDALVSYSLLVNLLLKC